MDFVRTYSAELTSIIAVVLAFLLAHYFRSKAKLIYSLRHSFTFILDPPKDDQGQVIGPQPLVRTASIAVSNVGREPARGVEIVFNWKPQFINVWPSRYYELKSAPDGRCCVILDSLASGEVFGMELLSIVGDLPTIITVRSESSEAKEVPMMPQQVHPSWLVNLLGALAIFGFASVIYWAVVGAQRLLG